MKRIQSVLASFALVAALLVAMKSPVRAYEESLFKFKVSTGVLEMLQPGPRMKSYLENPRLIELRTSKELTETDISSITTKGVLTSFFFEGGLNIPYEIDMQIDRGQAETDESLDDVKRLVATWRKDDPSAKILKKWKPTIANLQFHQDSGILETVRLTGRYPYQLIVQVPYDEKTDQWKANPASYEAVNRFLRFVEKDRRSRIILDANKSGLPAFISTDFASANPTVSLHHPMHSIIWDVKRKIPTYALIDSYSTVSRFPEVRKAAGNKDVRAFIERAGNQDIRVNLEGNRLAGYKIVFKRADTGEGFTVELRKRKINIRPGV